MSVFRRVIYLFNSSAHCGPFLGMIFFFNSKIYEEDTYLSLFKICSIGIFTGFYTVVQFLKICRKFLFLDLFNSSVTGSWI